MQDLKLSAPCPDLFDFHPARDVIYNLPMPYGPLQPDDVALRTLARHKIESRVLPCGPATLWAGHGDGQACILCGMPIAGRQVIYEVEFRGHPTLCFHIACHAAWQLECAEEQASGSLG